MKSLLSHTTIILLLRIFLGGVFVIASLDKITDPQAFANSILQYKIVGPVWAMGIATFLPSLELLCGLCVILGLFPRGGALLMTLMLVAFTVLVTSALVRGLDISCGCFSQDPAASKVGIQKILENGGLILISIWLFFVPNQGINLLQFFTKKNNTPIQ
jgi:putative oxidoreductase